MLARVSKQRYLVLHDYGMGGSWWWIHARSAREVRETFAEVVGTPADVARTEGWQLEEIDLRRHWEDDDPAVYLICLSNCRETGRARTVVIARPSCAVKRRWQSCSQRRCRSLDDIVFTTANTTAPQAVGFIRLRVPLVASSRSWLVAGLPRYELVSDAPHELDHGVLLLDRILIWNEAHPRTRFASTGTTTTCIAPIVHSARRHR